MSQSRVGSLGSGNLASSRSQEGDGDPICIASDHSSLAQELDIRRRIAQLVQDGIGVGAEIGGRAAEPAWRFAELYRETEHLDLAVTWMVDADDHFLVLGLRVGKDL